MRTKVNWINKYHLEGETETGHFIHMDSAPAGEETKGPTPKELLLQALAGCTMMDVSLILEKSRKHVDKFWIDVEADTAKEHPRVFTRIHLKYNLIGQDLDNKTVERAIELSRERYCSIYGMLQENVDITYSYELFSIVDFINYVLEDAKANEKV
ncbi:MAG: OsmC family peroxiredoxin [Ignavibacteriae bacterium]|nr:MAG: OsmC family peroxiredoxin [Ignavibacteriota bacterium]